MFTGIITAKEKINYGKKLKEGVEVKIKKPQGWNDLVIGESIAVNGVCLTVTSISDDEWTAFLMPETIAKTSFQSRMLDSVNLERAITLAERLSGHIVQGHVDGVGTVVSIDTTDGHKIAIEFPAEDAHLVIYKGSITIDGVSLTVSSVKGNTLEVAIIPHTLAATTLIDLKQDDLVNLEFDVIGKYVSNFLNKENHANS